MSTGIAQQVDKEEEGTESFPPAIPFDTCVHISKLQLKWFFPNGSERNGRHYLLPGGQLLPLAPSLDTAPIVLEQFSF